MERELTIRKLLKKCGISPDLNGYEIFVKLILKCIDDGKPAIYQKYVELGEELSYSICSIERSCRHAIETAFKEPNDFAKDLFEGLIKDKPTTGCFVYTLAEYVRIAEAATKPMEMFTAGWCERCQAKFHECYDNDVCKGFVDAGLNKLKFKEGLNEDTV